MDLETQDSLTKAVGEEPPVVTTTTATTFARLRQKRRSFGSTNEDLGKATTDNKVSPLLAATDSLARLTTPTDDFAEEEENDDDNGSGLFDAESVDGNTTTSTPDDRAEERETEDSLRKSTTKDTVLSEDESELEFEDDDLDDSGPTPEDQEAEESRPSSTTARDITTKVSEDASEESELEFESEELDDNTPESIQEETDVADHKATAEEDSSSEDEMDDAGEEAEMDDAEMDPENTDSLDLDTQESERPPADTPEQTDVTEPPADSTSPDEAKLPDRDSLITSTDQLFLQVTDREKVTVKDILQSLQIEYNCDKFDKASKAVVRERLTALILGHAQPLEGGSDDDEVEVSSSESEQEESDAEPEAEDSDFESAPRSKKPKSRLRKTLTKKKSKTVAERQNRVKRKSAAAVKAAAVRIQAEQLRKKRLEELRVRNEELELLQNQEEQKRAAKIAAKLETDTEELRLARFEERLDLLQKLDRKRILVIQDNIIVKVEEAPTEEKTNEVDKPVEASAEEDEEESSDDEMELELTGKPSKPAVSLQPDALSILNWAGKGLSSRKKKDSGKAMAKAATSDVSNDDFLSLLNGSKHAKTSPGKSLNARAFLKKRLLSRQRKMGNRWLARELGYQTEKEHVDECLKVENKKRLITIQKEHERIQANERTLLRERLWKAEEEAQIQDDEDEDDEEYKDPEESNENQEEDDEEEDEELAMAKQLETPLLSADDDDSVTQEAVADENETPVTNDLVNDDSDSKASGEASPVDNDDQPKAIARRPDEDFQQASALADPLEEPNAYETEAKRPSASINTEPTSNMSEEQEQAVADSNETPKPKDLSGESLVHSQSGANNETVAIEGETSEGSASNGDAQTVVEESASEKPKGPRNSAWRAMLQKEAERLKKKSKRKGEMIDDEADEEEEETIAGLEDFGFAMHKTKKADDDEDNAAADELNEDDLDNVVDDLSDGEGDEDAGEEARQAMEAREEKERHKDMMRRMREGYDGRRGGIAGGGAGARGVHRFDELVAADNREDAKRLGLLNDDELDSDDEGGEKPDNDEEDDEAAYLDKMLKDRFLHRSSVDLEENFSEDEQEEEENNAVGNGKNDDDVEEMEQARMAKRFTKRARMQRLIETHGHEEEFSQLKLMDEDTTLKEELQKIKNGLVRKRSHSNSQSVMSTDNSNLGGSKRQKADPSFSASNGSSLAIALQASKHKQNRTSFLRGSSTGSSETTASFQRSVGFKHVIFQSNSSRASTRGSKSQPPSLPGIRRAGLPGSSSLWSNVSRGFQKKH